MSGGLTASLDRWQRKRCQSSFCGDNISRNLMESTCYWRRWFGFGATRCGFLLLYQYDERTLSSIRALCLLLLSWRNKRSADLAQVGFGSELSFRMLRVKSSRLSVCIVNTGS